MKISDMFGGVLLAVAGAAIFAVALTFPPVPGQDVGPGLFPEMIALGLMVCGVLLAVRGRAAADAQAWVSLPDWLGDRRALTGFAVVPVTLVFYVAASETLGFLLTGAILLFVLFVTFGVRLRTALLFAPLCALGIHFLFYKLLKVPLPWGLLEPFAW